jgi:hypothetical protein
VTKKKDKKILFSTKWSRKLSNQQHGGKRIQEKLDIGERKETKIGDVCEGSNGRYKK